jgi:hypothetical protein
MMKDGAVTPRSLYRRKYTGIWAVGKNIQRKDWLDDEKKNGWMRCGSRTIKKRIPKNRWTGNTGLCLKSERKHYWLSIYLDSLLVAALSDTPRMD